MTILPFLVTLYASLPNQLPTQTEQSYDAGSLEEARARLAEVDRITPVVLVARSVKPAVVFIQTETTQQVRSLWGIQERTGASSGSGVLIHADGYIVTNNHVVKGARGITVSFADDPRPYPASLVSAVASEDLALLKIDPPPTSSGDSSSFSFPTVPMGVSTDLMEGERVVAIGNPHGQTHTVSTGIISGLHRDVPVPAQGLHFKDLIQTDASINLGNSGGPLLNIRGELIGINSAMNTAAENIGFAIPVDRVQAVLTQTLFPEARRVWLGFDLEPDLPLRIRQVFEYGPADQAGLKPGDRVESLAGENVKTQDQWLHATLKLKPQDEVTLRIRTAGTGARSIQLNPWDKHNGILFERLGLTARETSMARGTWITAEKVIPGGPAEQMGLEAGDLIPSVNARIGRSTYPLGVRSMEQLARFVSLLEKGTRLDLEIYRDDDGDRTYAHDEHYEGTLLVR